MIVQLMFRFSHDAESVVLAFGGVGEGSAVHVTRKVMRKKALWKVTK